MIQYNAIHKNSAAKALELTFENVDALNRFKQQFDEVNFFCRVYF